MSSSSLGNPASEFTLFSEKRFVEAIVHAGGRRARCRRLSTSSNGSHSIYAIEYGHRLGRRSLELGPLGLYASPNVTPDETRAAVHRVVAQLRGPRTISFTWNVRYDHSTLLSCLTDIFPSQVRQNSTHVLTLCPDYADNERHFSPTIRNQISRSHRQGVVTRRATTTSELEAYYEMHLRLVEEKGNYALVHPQGMFQALLALKSDAQLILAEQNQMVIGGGIFFRDGNSMFYWHGAMDRRYSRLYPACAVISQAIRWACSEGFKTVNFGGSLGIRSLEQFKEYWGAKSVTYNSFTWYNPLLRAVSRLGRRMYA